MRSFRAAKRVQGLTLVELMISLTVLVAILAITHFIFTRINQTWNRVSGDQGAGAQLQKAEGWLRRDLALASFEGMRVAAGPTSLSGKDGDAVWFLSAIDPSTGQFLRNSDGTPHWQRNILYYSVVPGNLADAQFQGSGMAKGGYEVSYPYKLLVRKQIDFGTPTTAGSTTSEELITDITPYLERPDGLDFSADDCEEVTVAANHLLSFQAAPDPALRSLRVVMQAASLEEARREFAIGTRNLLDPRFLLERRMEIFPENRMLTTP